MTIINNQSATNDKSEKIHELLSLYHDIGQFNGSVLVAENSQVILKEGYGLANIEWEIPNRVDTRFKIASLSKPFTAMLILQMAAEGKLELDGTITDYLPEYRKDTGNKVTIHHLLTHSSGIPSHTNIPDFLEKYGRNHYKVDEFVKKFCSSELLFEPGEKFRYNNSGYYILGAIIERISGKPYAEILQEKILIPLCMENSGYVPNEKIVKKLATGYVKCDDGYETATYLDMSIPYAGGGMYSSVEDIYLWDQALYTDLLLPEKFMNMIITPQFANTSYGWPIWRNPLVEGGESKTAITMSGGIPGFNVGMARLIDNKHLVVLLNNTGQTVITQIGRQIIYILYNYPFELPKPDEPEEIGQGYTG
ncbi:MAG: serine hydrolase domain-containing protein [Candidatus Hatepunaea meridiana]|nr:serine hydrolase domain-containing protein [Candidatus Hatepunaea meridiana]